MPTTCDPCCDPQGLARSQDSYRASHLQLLCNLLTAINGGNLPVPVIPNPAIFAPVSLISPWFNVINAGGMIVLDNANITNPETQIVSATRLHFLRNAHGVGTSMLLRMMYDAGLTAITNPVVKVFGRYNNTETWQLLQNKANATTGIITTSASEDVYNTGNTFRFTTPNYISQGWDLLGCNEIVVGLQVILAGTGTVNNATLQAKVI